MSELKSCDVNVLCSFQKQACRAVCGVDDASSYAPTKQVTVESKGIDRGRERTEPNGEGTRPLRCFFLPPQKGPAVGVEVTKNTFRLQKNNPVYDPQKLCGCDALPRALLSQCCAQVASE